MLSPSRLALLALSGLALTAAAQTPADPPRAQQAPPNQTPVNPAPANPAPANTAASDPTPAGPSPADSAPGDQGPNRAWKDKRYAEWTEDDANALIAGSPWVKFVTPAVVEPTPGGGAGRRIAIGGVSIPGLGHRRTNASSTNASSAGDQSSDPKAPTPAPVLTVRWESALPLRAAELKARETNAPDVDDGHYAIAVYGVPRSMLAIDSKELANDLKKHALLKRELKMDVRPSSVEILMGEDGPVILYLFPKSEEITWRDAHVQFEAQIGKLKFAPTFETTEMKFHGNLEL